MFRSPLKTVTEKIKPTQSKSGISSLKFERASDFKKFIGFIKTETKELEKIKLPKETEIKPKKKRGGILGLLGLGLLGVLGGGFGGDGDGESNERTGSEGGTASQFNTGILISRPRRTPIKLATKEGLGKDAKGKSRIKTTKYEQRRQKLRIKKNILRKRFREKRIDAQIKAKNKPFLDEFERLKKQRIQKARIQLGLQLFTEEEIPDFEVQKILDQDKGKFPGQMDQELANKIKARFAKKGKFFIDPGDPVARKQVASRIGFFDLLKKIEEPITLEDVKLMENLRDNVGGVTSEMSNEQKLLSMRAAAEAEELLNQPEFKTLLKEDKFQKITGTDTPKASSFFGGKFTPKYVLDDIFTGIGEKTKPLRKFFTPAAKNIAKAKIPFVPGNISLLGVSRGLGKVFPIIDAAGAVIALNNLGLVDFSNGILKPKVGQDNIVTGLYDMFTSFYNAGVEGFGFDDAHKRLMISTPKDRDKKFYNYFTRKTEVKNERRFIDAYNKEILEAREAKKLRDAINMNSNFNTSMLNNSSMQLPKSTPFSVQKVDGGEFNPPFDYSDMGTIDFSSAAILYKLNK